MIRELIRAVFTAGLPILLASFALVWWALKRNHVGSGSSLRELKKELKRQSRKKSEDKKRNKTRLLKASEADTTAEAPEPKRKADLLHNKWLAFGGGFYGVVGLVTYAVVELRELRDFFVGFESVSALLAQLGLDMLINLAIDALMNFIVAIAWPAYWMAEIHSPHIWIWFLVAYAAYWAGAKLALQRAQTPVKGRDGS